MRYTFYLHSTKGQQLSGSSLKKRKTPREMDFTRTFNYRYLKGTEMLISVQGHRSMKFKDELAVAAEFYASILLPRKYLKTIDLEIELKNKLDEDVAGYCEYLDKTRSTKEFRIQLCKKATKEELLKNLAHEMVHLKQFALGELSDGICGARSTTWHDRTYNDKSLSYWDEPWEIEAFGREAGLYYRYVEEFGI